jgi:hypothetical protein
MLIRALWLLGQCRSLSVAVRVIAGAGVSVGSERRAGQEGQEEEAPRGAHSHPRDQLYRKMPHRQPTGKHNRHASACGVITGPSWLVMGFIVFGMVIFLAAGH